jgi:hypothetical protein
MRGIRFATRKERRSGDAGIERRIPDHPSAAIHPAILAAVTRRSTWNASSTQVDALSPPNLSHWRNARVARTPLSPAFHSPTSRYGGTVRKELAMHDDHPTADDVRPPSASAAASAWSSDGVATLEAAGNDARSALEAGLRAALNLALGDDSPSLRPDTGRSAPIRGEGADLAALFVDLFEDLMTQVEFFGPGLDDVTLDAVLRGDDGRYIAWGYASGSLEPASSIEPPSLHGPPTAMAGEGNSVVIRAALRRP